MKKIKSLLILLFFFSGCISANDLVDGIYYEINSKNKTAQVVGCIINSPELIIPSNVTVSRKATSGAKIQVSYPVVAVSSLSSNKNITSITLSRNIQSIVVSAFKGCESLHTIIVAEGNENFMSEDGVLYNSSQTAIICCPVEKTEVSIPSSVNSINTSAFSKCKKIRQINIPVSVTSIEGSAFEKCEELGSISIPNSVKNIGESAFRGCCSFTTLTIPNSVTTIGEYNQEIKGKTNVEIIPVSA